ncbi:T-cell surface glycoprotein CD1b-2-like isoform X2 [Saccopteryx bilineata]|uniref:T-cell surface glycoprotein CD1b-2-like isoform X2 n=1 Tax=Saccopteryx bilineata TaxID=59482 RepID=UPI00338DCF0D
MLLLPLLLLAHLIPGADNKVVHKNAFQGPTSFHVIQISSFVNSTYAQNQGSGWLEDLQIHGWDSDSGTAIFLKPWSKGNFSDAELTEVVEAFRVYFIEFTPVVQDRVSEFELTYPFEIQAIGGCEMHSGETTVSFWRAALGGVNLMNFQNDSCVPAAEGGSRGQRFCAILSEYQVKPKAWLSSGPPPLPGHLLLVCHVSGFYPKPVQVMWMKDEQEHPGTHQGDMLPNADETWYLQVTLDVVAGEEANLNCRVKHSSLGSQDIVLHWGHLTSAMVITLAIILPTFILLICLTLWYLRRRSYQNIQ